ncbi:MAG: adenosylcobinamide-GDP ribazoletransferase [Nitrospirota bacterium]|nr:adenosylcobinamide-GDP ribazoletransferase [Nitrospirota bacterium]
MSASPISGLLTAGLDAARFLTRLPVPSLAPDGERAEPHPWTMAMFPVVGLFLGAAAWTVWWGLRIPFSQPVADILIIGILALLSGAIHWDGLMDTADALGAPPERRLEVLRDPHVGSFGLLALVFVAAVQWAGLTGLHGWIHGSAIILFPIWGRLSMAAVTWHMADLREGEGLAGVFTRQVEMSHLLWGGGFTLLISVLLLGYWTAVVAVGVAAGVYLLRFAYRRFFRGITGDMIGATCCVVEALVLGLLGHYPNP